ncbi:hypothetical protein Hanom_Chr03g00252201 [Helianthus anomalus]
MRHSMLSHDARVKQVTRGVAPRGGSSLGVQKMGVQNGLADPKGRAVPRDKDFTVVRRDDVF